jgi:LmbE family N-acetylglucosaminyl deacetylase
MALINVIILAMSGIITYLRAPNFNIDIIDNLRPIKPNDRILVFAPHCDDEILGSAGLIMNALETGAKVKIVLITNGDNNLLSTDLKFKTVYPTARKFIQSGEIRQQETINALKYIGVDKKDIVFLGYPDRGIKAMYKKNWLISNPYRSSATRKTKAPYQLIYEPDVTYCGENLLRNINEIMASFSPTIVIGPHLKDQHPDHRYGILFILKAINNLYGPSQNENKPVLLTYLIHYPYFPRLKGLKPDSYILAPFTATFDMKWYKYLLTEDQEKIKQKTISFYGTQLKFPELTKLMRSFIRKNELFEEIEAREKVDRYEWG